MQKQSESRPLIFKVSEKKAISIYGINSRFPVTLYKNQLLRLLDHSEQLKIFIENHSDELATKDNDTEKKETKSKKEVKVKKETKSKKEAKVKLEENKEGELVISPI